MPLDGQGFHVEIEQLEQAKRSMDAITQKQSDSELRDMCGEVSTVGTPRMREALMNYCVRYSGSLDMLVRKAGTMQQGLGKAAAAYRETERGNTQHLTVDPADQPLKDQYGHVSDG